MSDTGTNMENGTLKKKSLIEIICAMLIWGSVGIFRRSIPLSSAMLACVRGLLGGGTLLLFYYVKKWTARSRASHSRTAQSGVAHPRTAQSGAAHSRTAQSGTIHPDAAHSRATHPWTAKQFLLLVLTGAALGCNWILLFESYNYTSVAISTLCYYMEPTILILLSPLLFREKLTLRKLICVIVSFIGISLISGVFQVKEFALADFKGILLGLGAAALYSMVVILNKKNPVDSVYPKTIVQLFSAAVAVIPYILLTEKNAISELLSGNAGSFRDSTLAGGMNATAWLMLFIVGIAHTGIAYAFYFKSMDGLEVQTVAILSYLDPIFAIILSTLVLREQLTIFTILGAVCIIAAAIASEWKTGGSENDKSRRTNKSGENDKSRRTNKSSENE